METSVQVAARPFGTRKLKRGAVLNAWHAWEPGRNDMLLRYVFCPNPIIFRVAACASWFGVWLGMYRGMGRVLS